jgi:hypothetical protein
LMKKLVESPGRTALKVVGFISRIQTPENVQFILHRRSQKSYFHPHRPLLVKLDGRWCVVKVGNANFFCGWGNAVPIRDRPHIGRTARSTAKRMSIALKNVSSPHLAAREHWVMRMDLDQCCHDPGLTRSDPDPSSSDLTLIDWVMIGQGLC